MKTLGKSETNAFARYKYVSIDSYLETIPAIAAEEGLYLSPPYEQSVTIQLVDDKAMATFLYSWDLVHESGAAVEDVFRTSVVHPVTGPQTSGSALAYGEKMAWRFIFKVPTGEVEDGDAVDNRREIPFNRRELLLDNLGDLDDDSSRPAPRKRGRPKTSTPPSASAASSPSSPSSAPTSPAPTASTSPPSSTPLTAPTSASSPTPTSQPPSTSSSPSRGTAEAPPEEPDAPPDFPEELLLPDDLITDPDDPQDVAKPDPYDTLMASILFGIGQCKGADSIRQFWGENQAALGELQRERPEAMDQVRAAIAARKEAIAKEGGD